MTSGALPTALSIPDVDLPVVSSDVQVALSLGTLLAVVALWAAARWAVREYRDGANTRLVEASLGVLLLALVLAGGASLMVIWDAERQVAAALTSLGGSPVAIGIQAFVTVAAVVVVYVLTGVIHRTVDSFLKQREGVSDHQAEVTYRVLQLSLYVFTALTILYVWGVRLSGLLIGAGFAGIVLGMAARQTLGALLAGFVLMFSRPFEIGDWVEVGDAEGIVTDVTIVNTRIQTFDGEYVMLPNDYVGSEEIVNKSRKGRIRLHVEVGVDYATDLDRALEVATETMKDVEEILSVPRPQAVLMEFGASAVTIDLRFWIDKPSARRKWRAHTAVISAVHEAFEAEGIKIPFPQRELSGRAETGGFRVAGEVPSGVAPRGGEAGGAEDAKSGESGAGASEADAGAGVDDD